jgi:dephospho-CoA kinase
LSSRQYLLGLTGSIGMGKSTTAQMFRDLGVPVWDADETVHDLYEGGGFATAKIAAVVPSALSGDRIDRGKLRTLIRQNPDLLKRIEAVVHPLLDQYRTAFKKRNAGEKLLVFDIPLLFELGTESWLDGVLVVTAPPEVQKQRVMSRPMMEQSMYESLMARQLPDAEKRKRASFVIDTSLGMDHARREVSALVDRLKGDGQDA